MLRLWNDYNTPNGSISYTKRTETFGYDSLNRLSNTTGSTGVPSKTLTYNLHGNILSKDGRTYSYGTAGKPHQLTQITGCIHGASSPTYTYDANGNILTGGGATISWTSFNMVNSMAQGSNPGSQSSTFLYGPEHQRIKQTAAYNGQNITTWYINGFELEWNTSSNVKEAKYYITGKIIHSETGTAATPATTQTKYLHKDHLGMVHMSGRIYDASLGRFMSADPFIAQPTNLQNYNRYAYVNNNPLSYTDPSGFFIKKLLRPKPFALEQKVNRMLLKAMGPSLSSYAVAIGSAFCTPAGYALCAAAGTFHCGICPAYQGGPIRVHAC